MYLKRTTGDEFKLEEMNNWSVDIMKSYFWQVHDISQECRYIEVWSGCGSRWLGFNIEIKNCGPVLLNRTKDGHLLLGVIPCPEFNASSLQSKPDRPAEVHAYAVCTLFAAE